MGHRSTSIRLSGYLEEIFVHVFQAAISIDDYTTSSITNMFVYLYSTMCRIEKPFRSKEGLESNSQNLERFKENRKYLSYTNLSRDEHVIKVRLIVR